MYYFIDESGNTGQNIFDNKQPFLYYGMIGSATNLDVVVEPLLKGLRKRLGVKRLHASKLGPEKIASVAGPIAKFSKKKDIRFSLFKVSKRDHAIITCFDQIFDSGLNDAIPRHHYFTPLRYVLLFKVAHLFDEDLARLAWKARLEQNPGRCAEMLGEICDRLLSRITRLPDARSRELISGALKWARANPDAISYGSSNKESSLQISPNLVGFQQVLQGIALHSSKTRKKVRRVTVDRQTEFNLAQGELAEWYRALRKAPSDTGLGPGMPSFDWSMMPDVPPTFMPGDQSAGLEIVDLTLWIAKKLNDGKSLPPELYELFWSQARRGHTDEVSLEGLDKRWRHLVTLPEADGPLPEDLERIFADAEERRLRAVADLQIQ